METERLKEIIECYGADQSHWPAAERVAAARLLDTNDETRAQIKDAARLDALLDEFQPPIVSQALKRKILLITRPGSIERLFRWVTPDLESLLPTIWRPLLAATMPLALGMVLGFTYPGESYELSTGEELYLLAITSETVSETAPGNEPENNPENKQGMAP